MLHSADEYLLTFKFEWEPSVEADASRPSNRLSQSCTKVLLNAIKMSKLSSLESFHYVFLSASVV